MLLGQRGNVRFAEDEDKEYGQDSPGGGAGCMGSRMMAQRRQHFLDEMHERGEQAEKGVGMKHCTYEEEAAGGRSGSMMQRSREDEWGGPGRDSLRYSSHEVEVGGGCLGPQGSGRKPIAKSKQIIELPTDKQTKLFFKGSLTGTVTESEEELEKGMPMRQTDSPTCEYPSSSTCEYPRSSYVTPA